jgi:uncharacterized protein (DUF3084 family)
MIVAGVAIVAAIGLGAWALVLNDDLNDTEAQLDAQTAAAQSASSEAEQDVADAQAEAAETQSELEQARAERDVAQAEADQARAEADQAELCSDASLAATQGLAETDNTADGYEAAASSAETAASACP